MPITLILNLAILFITSLGIGSAILTLLAPKLKLHPAESLCIAIALSWLTVFQLAFAAFAAGHFSLAPIPIFVLSLLSLVIARKQLLRWVKYPFTRAMLAAFSLLLAWHLLNHAITINYSWGFWWGDWFEHFERMLFFSLQAPLESQFLGGRYTLPARPPMQNVCQAYVHTLASTPFRHSFAAFQVSSTFLATLLALPVFLIARRMARGQRPSDSALRDCASFQPPPPQGEGRGEGVLGSGSFARKLHRPRLSVWLIAALLAVTWPFLINALFTWTKSFCAFYVLLALALYLRPPSRQRDTLVFLIMGAGVVVHYSAILILAPLLLWHAATFIKRPTALPAAILCGIPGILVILPWVLFVQTAMPGAIVSATSSAHLASQFPLSQTAVWALHNAVGALLPLLGGKSLSDVKQSLTHSLATDWRPVLFMLTQHTLALAAGLIGIFIASVEALRARSRRSIPTQTWFWLFILLGAAIGLGIVHPNKPTYGVGHIALLPFFVLPAAWAAGLWPTLSTTTRTTLFILAALQMLNIIVDTHHLSSTPLIPDIPLPHFDPPWTGNQPLPGFDPHRTTYIHPNAFANLVLKHQNNLHFLADSLAPWLKTLWYASTLFALAWLLILARHIKPRPHHVEHLTPNI